MEDEGKYSSPLGPDRSIDKRMSQPGSYDFTHRIIITLEMLLLYTCLYYNQPPGGWPGLGVSLSVGSGSVTSVHSTRGSFTCSSCSSFFDSGS